MKSAVPFQVIFLIVGLGCASAGGTLAPDTAGFEKSPPAVSYFDRQRYQRIAGEEQERYRKRVPIPEAVGEDIPVAAAAGLVGRQAKLTTQLPAANLFSDLLLAVACGLAVTLFFRNLAPRIIAIVNNRFNPWALLPCAAADFSTQVRAEEEAFSEFLTASRAGPLAVCRRSLFAANSAVLQGALKGACQAASGMEHNSAAEFLARAPKLVTELRKLVQEVSRTQDAAARQTMLSDLCGQMRALKGEAGIPDLLPAWQMAGALEGLLMQLTRQANKVTPSTLRTVASGVELLDELCQPGLRADLCTQPPFHLLAADDDAISRRAISFALKRGLNQPYLAEHGPAALALATTQPYDVIFLDVQMPGVDGFELCTKIHQTIPNRRTPVVFVTCQSDFNGRAQSVLCGGNDLIGKPFLSFEITVKALTLALRARLENSRPEPGSVNQQPQTVLLPKSGGSVEVPAVAVSPDRGLPVAEVHAGGTVGTVTSVVALSLPGKDYLRDPAPRDIPACVEPRRTDAANPYYRQSPGRLEQVQSQFHAARHATDVAVRQKLLGELSAALLSLAAETRRAALNSSHRLCSALEGLLRKMHQRADYCTPTALDAVGSAHDLIEELGRSGAEPDLAAPPIRILVVDDDLIARRAFVGAVQMAFGRPDSAPNGEAALALAGKKRFDVIFLDVRMPGMDGFTTCAKIHETPANHSTSNVFVTGHSDLESRSQAARSGGCGFIPKPVLAAEIMVTALTFTMRGRLRLPRPVPALDAFVLPRTEVSSN